MTDHDKDDGKLIEVITDHRDAQFVFVDHLYAIAATNGVARLRFTTSVMNNNESDTSLKGVDAVTIQMPLRSFIEMAENVQRAVERLKSGDDDDDA